MTCPMRSAPRYDCLLMIQPCISHWKVRMTVQHSKMISTFDRHWRPGGIQSFEMSSSTCDRIQETCKKRLHTAWTGLGVYHKCRVSWSGYLCCLITGNANPTLSFVRPNIKTKMSKVRETAYTTLVRPQLEYASAVWDPHTI